MGDHETVGHDNNAGAWRSAERGYGRFDFGIVVNRGFDHFERLSRCVE